MLFDGGRFAYFVEGFEKGFGIGFVGVEGDGDGFGIEVTDDVLDPFLEGDILHDFIAASLTVQVHIEDDGLFIDFGVDCADGQGESQKDEKPLFHRSN